MTTTRTQIRAFLDEWASSETSPHSSVMIEGGWGCGKTHFVNSLIEDGKFAQRKAIYLSTSGFTNIQVLETNFLYASMSDAAKWAHRGVSLAGSFLNSSLTIGSGGILGGSADLTKVVKSVTRQIEKSFKSPDCAVLILDDLERCRIPMAELLDVINRYVEHGDTRVILVANTAEINNHDFTLFRDKVVGHSFRFASDPDDALASFIKEVSDPEIRTIIEMRRDQIRELHDLSGYQNLRALRQFVGHLQGIVTKLDEQYRENEHLIEKMTRAAFIFFTEFKLDLSEDSKILSPKDLLGPYNFDMPDVRHVYERLPDDENEPTPKKKVLLKYKAYNGVETVVTVDQWISTLETGLIDQTWLNKEIADSEEVAELPVLPSWKRLWRFHEWDFSNGSDEEFWATLADLNKHLDEGQYRCPAEFRYVACVLIMLSKNGLHEASVPDTVRRLKKYVDCHLVPAVTFETYKEFTSELRALGGLYYSSKDDPEFQEVDSHLKARMKDWCAEWLRKGAGLELLSYISGDLQRFFGNIIAINSEPEQRYLNKAILQTIKPKKFVDAWLNLSGDDERSLVKRIKDRYNYRPETWTLEGPWWCEVRQELKSRRNAERVRPRAVQIGFLVGHIDQLIYEQSGKTGG